MKVLLIEPDVLLANTYKVALTAAGHEVLHAKTAQGAVAHADKSLPDVVVLEMQMPRHSGVEFLYEFKSYSEWQNIPVIVLTTIPTKELASVSVLRKELSVRKILHKSHTDLKQLCDAVADVTQAES